MPPTYSRKQPLNLKMNNCSYILYCQKDNYKKRQKNADMIITVSTVTIISVMAYFKFPGSETKLRKAWNLALYFLLSSL